MATKNLSGIRKYTPKPVATHGLGSASTIREDAISYRVVRTEESISNKKSCETISISSMIVGHPITNTIFTETKNVTRTSSTKHLTSVPSKTK